MKLTTQPIDLTILIPRCHEASKANGWWEPKPNAGQQLMLVVSELSEALEADRNGKRALWDTYYTDMHLASAASAFPVIFRENIKDSVGDELADAYIRLCDFAGGFGLSPAADGMTYDYMIERRSQTLPENFGEALLVITRHISDLHKYAKGKSPALTNAMTGIEALCKREGIDLATHIDLKLAYNATRGHKHGGKAY